MDGEASNAGFRSSQLRPPTRYAATASRPTLQEISESESNARSQASMLPTSRAGLKRAHTSSATLQPDAKQRKTLATRAEEFPSKQANSDAIAPRHVKAVSLVPQSGIKPPSTALPPLTRQNANGSRNGASSIARPGSSMAYNASTLGRTRANTNRARPVTALGHHIHEDETAQDRQNSTQPPYRRRRSSSMDDSSLSSRQAPATTLSRTTSGASSNLSAVGEVLPQKPRDISLSTHFNKLHIREESREDVLARAQVASNENNAVSTAKGGKNQQTSKATKEGAKEEDASGQGSLPVAAWREGSLIPVQTPMRRLKTAYSAIDVLKGKALGDKAPPIKSAQALEDNLTDFGVKLASLKKAPAWPFKSSPTKPLPYLTRGANLRDFTAFDVDERLGDMEAQFKSIKDVVNGSLGERKAMEEAIDMAKLRANDLERDRNQLRERNDSLQTEVENLRQQLQALSIDAEHERRTMRYDIEDKTRAHCIELDELRKTLGEETERLKRQHQDELEAVKRHFSAEIADNQHQASREMEQMQSKLEMAQQSHSLALQGKDSDADRLREEQQRLREDIARENALKSTVQVQVEELHSANKILEAQLRTTQAQVHFLESDSKQQSDSFANMEMRMQEALGIAERAKEKLIKEETERRALFNKYQELKGNIRVMCRVRPALKNAAEDVEAKLSFPDEKTSAQLEVMGPETTSSLGNVVRQAYPFEFDRVFAPSVQNEEVFDEICQLVQSALDGYNVCIFCYGQTGSGKTYTMSSADGMIPRATKMIYETVEKLKDKSWAYTMEGNFVEVYNEELHDLLAANNGKDADPKKRPDFRHDEGRKTTTILNCKTVSLDSANTVESMLRQAASNRSVAATKANERSSRSHSVFILKLAGHNSATDERCEGTLNLVDLAGSERLKHSGAEGDRMKETQNINKSLACLGDVIEALGRSSNSNNGNGHVPYRNSKLTHLLQYSLGGNSKTLMFVMVSPLEAHLKETLTSLRFATKVHNTHIGTAKATKK